VKKNCVYILTVITSVVMLASCQKDLPSIEKLKKSCLYNDKIDYFKKWANTYTEIKICGCTSSIAKNSVIDPIGYFQLNSDGSYNVYSDGVPLSGKWTVTPDCKLMLDSNTVRQRAFDVVSLNSDSIVLKRKSGDTTFIQHYLSYHCPSESQLEYRWDNTTTVIQNYDIASVITGSQTIYPDGYFTLNPDKTYNVLSNGVPLDGQWLLDQNSCKLVLDKGMPLERAFDIQQITTDSLTIWRKDTLQKVNYLQHYIKYH